MEGCGVIKAATWAGLPRSKDGVGAGKFTVGGVGDTFSRAKASRSNGTRSDANEQRDSEESCGVGLLGVASEGLETGRFSV